MNSFGMSARRFTRGKGSRFVGDLIGGIVIAGGVDWSWGKSWVQQPVWVAGACEFTVVVCCRVPITVT
jgi:hypothetical protein